MRSLWSDEEAKSYSESLLETRVYTSRLLGRESSLVLHGGGNTSVKAKVKDFFGEEQEILYVKGSGWDLVSIEAPGFAPVKMDVLLKLAEIDDLSDEDMVIQQRAAMLDPAAPNPSVEAILHALIPYRFVDHTHTDAVVTLTNQPNGEEIIREIYGDRVLIVPYVMPGFILAKTIRDLTRGVDWSQLDGLVLMNHGVFTFDEGAKESYEKMIQIVSQAEDYIDRKFKKAEDVSGTAEKDLLQLAEIRKEVSKIKGSAQIVKLEQSNRSLSFSKRSDIAELACRGTLTPDHVIRTKPFPLILGQKNVSEDVSKFSDDYLAYFKKFDDGKKVCLDLAPKWAVWPGFGTMTFGNTVKEARISADILEHTIDAVTCGESLGRWEPLALKELFEVEYWSLEQAKLKKSSGSKELQGKIALVTGAASGIGRACVDILISEGAAVIGVDLNSDVETMVKSDSYLGFCCDVSDDEKVKLAIEKCIETFGGLDILVNNAGIFPPSCRLEGMDQGLWNKSMELNLNSQQRILSYCTPYLKHGVDASVVFIASKNVPAPGPGASAYSVAKAGATQLARVAALELAGDGIRVNTIHPNAVFDTALWTQEVIEARAKQYGLSVDAYKTNNLLRTEICSKDVAELMLAMVGKSFAKTTGSQVPIDGGNDRVI